MTTVGIDLGADSVTAVRVDENGRILARASRGSSDLATAARDALRDARQGCAHVDALGVTIPFHADALPPDVIAAVSQNGDVTPTSISGGQALALAETWTGAATGSANVIALAIGEHVTAGILVGGRLLRGANGHAGSVAWLALNPVEREDYRRHGGLEAEVAAAGIVRRLVWRIKSGDRSRVVDRVNGELSRLTAEDVFAAAREGDGVCVSVVRDTAKYVGMAVANLATIIDPECVVLGGTLAATGDLMLEAIRSECRRRLRPAVCERIRLVLSTLGPEAAALGAARAALLERQ